MIRSPVGEPANVVRLEVGVAVLVHKRRGAFACLADATCANPGIDADGIAPKPDQTPALAFRRAGRRPLKGLRTQDGQRLPPQSPSFARCGGRRDGLALGGVGNQRELKDQRLADGAVSVGARAGVVAQAGPR